MLAVVVTINNREAWSANLTGVALLSLQSQASGVFEVNSDAGSKAAFLPLTDRDVFVFSQREPHRASSRRHSGYLFTSHRSRHHFFKNFSNLFFGDPT